jgi:hypothetical protein
MTTMSSLKSFSRNLIIFRKRALLSKLCTNHFKTYSIQSISLSQNRIIKKNSQNPFYLSAIFITGDMTDVFYIVDIYYLTIIATVTGCIIREMSILKLDKLETGTVITWEYYIKKFNHTHKYVMVSGYGHYELYKNLK